MDVKKQIPKSILDYKLLSRMAYARDASMYRLMPKGVAFPKSKKEVKDILSFSRSTKTPITFRAGGTSLSGQSITDGILVEILHNWSSFEILNNGSQIKMQPGVSGGLINRVLKPYGKKIGPDPASINTARIGGIVSNNSSGMVCGTEYNSYHTIKDLSFILANGNEYSTKKKEDRERFFLNELALANGLMKIRSQILDSSFIQRKIRSKYRIKNTIGYSMNSFLDFDNPLDIFAHLLVGAEGTLAFISEIIMNTIPSPSNKGTGLILFKSMKAAANTVPYLKSLMPSSIEFLDDQSLRTAKHVKNPPYNPSKVYDGCTGLLVEFENEKPLEISKMMKELRLFSDKEAEIQRINLVTDESERNTIWKIRKGLYPTLGALRNSGTTVITEDIALDLENIAEAVSGLKQIFKKRKYNDGVIFGHAKDGNLHFLTSIDLNSSSGIKNYEGMMNDLSEMTLGRFNGSLKAEHGTGRNMAPFVESEWGGEIYELMWKIKTLSDPNNILNKDVLLSRDKKLHLKNLKPLPSVHDEVDMCVECGYCEKICPSSGLTLTPRQRIAVLREMKVMNIKNELTDFDYLWDKTCATDGLCAEECPVNINVGNMVKSFRGLEKEDNRFVKFLGNNFHFTLSIVKCFIFFGNFLSNLIGKKNFRSLTQKLNFIFFREFPVWPKNGIMNVSSFNLPTIKRSEAEYILFPSCSNRIIPGNRNGESSSSLLSKISTRAGIKIKSIDNFKDTCCGMAFESRGYRDTSEKLRERLIKLMEHESQNGKLPIIVDLSPCTKFIKDGDTGNLEIIDSVTFLNSIKEKLNISKIKKTVYVHPVCSSQKMGQEDELIELANFCSEKTVTAVEKSCCGMGGDKGLRVPELPANSINNLKIGNNVDFGVSSSRTCEIGLMDTSSLDFVSIEELVATSILKSS
tara:strand:- start:14148 stop:16895 length:2748 start_codon:yes stop_codon:yes gene_type:complete